MKDGVEIWSLKDFPQVERIGNNGLVRLLDVRGRQLLMARELGKRVWLCGETPVVYPSTREVWMWLGVAFMLGSVLGGFAVLLTR